MYKNGRIKQKEKFLNVKRILHGTQSYGRSHTNNWINLNPFQTQDKVA